MQLTCLGAVRTVTGSMHLVEAADTRVLLDCGLFQGRRAEANERNRALPFDPREIDVVVLSHAHIDHSGNLPQLARQGFKGLVYATPATRDLCSAMLRDSAHIQKSDVEFVNKRRTGDEPPIEPLYGYDDVVRILGRFVGVPYGASIPLSGGLELTFHDAGHILGSAVCVLEETASGVRRRLGFTGDLGRRERPILRDPVRPIGLDALITESTYGGRLHPPVEQAEAEIARVVLSAVEHSSVVIVPAFAVDRTQELVYRISRLQEAGTIPEIPIYVDSPLAVDVTEIYRMHPEVYDADVREMIEQGGKPFGFHNLTYIRHAELSKRLNSQKGPMIIISASGMAEAGRILHHLRNHIDNPNDVVLIVGYQAHGTLGRRLVEGEKTVRIFGESHVVRAQVKVLNALSAHADQSELLEFILHRSDPDKRVFIVHGDEDQSAALERELRQRGAREPLVPELGRAYRI